MNKSTVRSVTLIGMPSAGKTRVGKLLSETLRWPFVDTDHLIVDRFGAIGLQEVVDELSREEYAALEEAIGVATALTIRRPTVIATGGSMVYSQKAMQFLAKRTLVVYLEASLETIKRRVEKRPDRGIVFDPGETLADLYGRRIPMYRQWAHRTVDANGDHRRSIATGLAESLAKEDLV